ncbi:MAG: rhomboid family intramembrane serine protease, partial [Candidatus Aenigmatarchaeota archaeon]
MRGQLFPYADNLKTKSFPIITVALIAANAAVFLWSTGNFEAVIMAFGFVPALFPSAHAFTTLLTSMFLHGGIDHIFGNMWYLWIFGDNVEDFFGKFRFSLIYIVSGVGASLFQYATDPASNIPSIGASGAISGVLGAYFVLFPKSGVLTSAGYSLITIPSWIVIGFWFAMQLFFGAASLFG